ncbi:Putative LOC100572414, partial [Caligus rogercresseyi]
MEWPLMNHVWGFACQTTHVLLVNKAIEPKMCLITEDDFTMKIRVIFESSLRPFDEFPLFE